MQKRVAGQPVSHFLTPPAQQSFALLVRQTGTLTGCPVNPQIELRNRCLCSAPPNPLQLCFCEYNRKKIKRQRLRTRVPVWLYDVLDPKSFSLWNRTLNLENGITPVSPLSLNKAQGTVTFRRTCQRRTKSSILFIIKNRHYQTHLLNSI